MAVDLLSENSNMSPRISFSRDFIQSDSIPIEKRPLRPSSSSSNSKPSSLDFDFCIPGGVNSGESFDQGSWSAAELFSDGKILPTEIKKKPEPIKPDQNQNQNTGLPKPESKNTDDDVAVTTEEKHNTKSFWGFKRSSSLNCGSSYGRSLCPLPLLNRSNSTGSASTKPKQSTKKQHTTTTTTEHTKLQHASSLSSSSSSSSSSYQKPPLKKSYGGYSYGSHGNGIRVSPVINMVPSSVSMFGLGSIFSGNGRDKNKKR